MDWKESTDSVKYYLQVLKQIKFLDNNGFIDPMTLHWIQPIIFCMADSVGSQYQSGAGSAKINFLSVQSTYDKEFIQSINTFCPINCDIQGCQVFLYVFLVCLFLD